MTFSRQLESGDAGITTTLWAMKAMVDDAIEQGTAVRALAARIGSSLRAVFDYLVGHVRFLEDPRGIESVRHPDHMIREILQAGSTAGDCDDMATLGAAILRALGFQPCFIVVSARASGEFHHVFFGARVDGELITLDPQQRIFNAMPATITRTLVFDV